MMNYIALHVTNYLIRNVITNDGDEQDPIFMNQLHYVQPWLQSLNRLFQTALGNYYCYYMVLIMWFILEKTTRGFELRAVGFNQHAAQYAGMNVNKNIILSMVISGAFAGLAGAMEGLGTFGYAAIKGGFTGVGFDGIAVALLVEIRH